MIVQKEWGLMIILLCWPCAVKPFCAWCVCVPVTCFLKCFWKFTDDWKLTSRLLQWENHIWYYYYNERETISKMHSVRHGNSHGQKHIHTVCGWRFQVAMCIFDRQRKCKGKCQNYFSFCFFFDRVTVHSLYLYIFVEVW